MAEKKKQTMRYSEKELSLIKSTFSENDELVVAIRKVFLQMPLTVIEASMIAGQVNADVLAIMKKSMNPELDSNAPLGQMIDLWATLDTKGVQVSELLPIFRGRELLIRLLEQQLDNLRGIAEKTAFEQSISLKDLVVLGDKTAEEFYPGLIARNIFINHVDFRLLELVTLAGTKTETVEETIARLQKNSSK